MIDWKDEFKNPNGTYNGLKLLSKLSGIPEDECLSIWKKVKADNEVEKTPECFGQYDLISWSARAENGCNDCPYVQRCIDARKDD